MNMSYFVILPLVCLFMISGINADENATLKFSEKDLSLMIGEVKTVSLIPSNPIQNAAVLEFTYDYGDGIKNTQIHHLLAPLPDVRLPANQTTGVKFNVKAINAGHFNLGVKSNSTELQSLVDLFLKIDVVHNNALKTISAVIGWIYFVAWSISFYPQVYENWKRKSVVGLNFDFLAYNITGFVAYGIFNVGIYWVPSIQDEYKRKHPRGIVPVQLNDVIFTLHAIFVTIVTICQCLIYERGGQKISKICRVLLVLAWLFIIIALFVTIGNKITWLTYIYYFSFVKLGVTIIKYIPQAYMNFRRKSTSGWSIGNVLLDFTGGSFSLLQMFMLSYNSGEWNLIFLNPTKFGLGIFTILFDILFMRQHYLYTYSKPSVAYQLVDNMDTQSVTFKTKLHNL